MISAPIPQGQISGRVDDRAMPGTLTAGELRRLLGAPGAHTPFTPDSPLGIQRLNQEAAKALFAGRRAGLEISDDEALRWITANPAWALGLEHATGTIEAGKLADLVIWSGDPLELSSTPLTIMIGGSLQSMTNHQTKLRDRYQ